MTFLRQMAADIEHEPKNNNFGAFFFFSTKHLDSLIIISFNKSNPILKYIFLCISGLLFFFQVVKGLVIVSSQPCRQTCTHKSSPVVQQRGNLGRYQEHCLQGPLRARKAPYRHHLLLFWKSFTCLGSIENPPRSTERCVFNRGKKIWVYRGGGTEWLAKQT